MNRPSSLTPFLAVCAIVLSLTAPLPAQSPPGSSRYPFPPRPLPEAEEIALAMSAAPDEVSARADVYVLRGTAFVKAREGTNGCACIVVRELHEGSLYPICFDREGVRTVMLREMKETSLRAQGMSEAQVQRAIEDALARGELTKASRPSLAYMMSPRQVIFSSPDSSGRRVGAWQPHVMMTGVGLTAEQIGLLPGSRYQYVQAGGTPGTLHEFVAIVSVWSDGKPAPAPSSPRP